MDYNVRAAPVNLFFFSLTVSGDERDTKRHSCELPAFTLSISCMPGDDFELKRRISKDATRIRRLGKWHGKAYGCNRSRRCEHRSERSHNSLCLERCNQARRSSSPRYILLKSTLPPFITLRIKLIPLANQIVCICPPPAGQNAVKKQFKVVILDVYFIIRTKKLTDAAELLIRKLLL